MLCFVNEAIKSRQRKEQRIKKSQGFRFSLNVAFNLYLFPNEPIQRKGGGKKKKKMRFVEADPGNTTQGERIEQHVDSFQKFPVL